MMERILTYLRDPIWQAIGVAVAIIGIFITLAPKSNQVDELSIVHTDKLEIRGLSPGLLKLIVTGTNKEIVTGVLDFYTIVNKSNRPILASAFTTPITLSKGPHSKNIFAVSSCGLFAANTLYDYKLPASVELNWIQSGDKWVASPALLNPNDNACVSVLSEEVDPLAKSTTNRDRLQWDGRIVNVQIKAYESVEAKLISENQWTEPLKTLIILRGFGAYWFVTLQFVLFFTTATLASQAGWISSYYFKDVLRLAMLVVLATGTAEVLTHIFINSNGFMLHFSSWIFLAGHVAFAVWMITMARRRRELRVTAT